MFLRDIPFYLKNSDFYKSLEENSSDQEDFNFPFFNDINFNDMFVISNFEQFMDQIFLENYWGTYSMSVPLAAYIIFNHDKVLQFLTDSKKYYPDEFHFDDLLMNVLTFDFINYMKGPLIFYIEKYMNSQSDIIQDIKNNINYTFSVDNDNCPWNQCEILVKVNDTVIYSFLTHIFTYGNYRPIFNPRRIINYIENESNEPFDIFSYMYYDFCCDANKNMIEFFTLTNFTFFRMPITQFNKYNIVKSLEEVESSMIRITKQYDETFIYQYENILLFPFEP